MSEKWTARHGRIFDKNGSTRVVECRGAGFVDGDEMARDIVARLNGPSPTEVAVMLRSVEWVIIHKMGDGYSFLACAVCSCLESDGHAKDCKLAAMIKQCEEA